MIFDDVQPIRTAAHSGSLMLFFTSSITA